MEEHNYEEEKQEKVTEEDEFGTDFMDGYDDDEEVEECSECGSAVHEERKVIRTIGGEKFTFCSKECADEFEETMGEN
ncbi:hypothetical protein COY27_05100 [Candidatus Woesearchaeota archaeon CG_4_10_14_0_2_um_filter_33_13]|nr:MAG: hypothetical protein COY27_05100 [Candidatus Woesearchaeota archaeon CG_4_10_14_0_2_um_filter_33_13]